VIYALNDLEKLRMQGWLPIARESQIFDRPRLSDCLFNRVENILNRREDVTYPG
jgi:hypothetical protein